MVHPGTPAALGGVHIGDKVIQVDTLQFRPGMTAQQAVGHLSGLAGTQVHLTIVREALKSSHSDTIRLTLTRAPVHLPAVPFTLLLDWTRPAISLLGNSFRMRRQGVHVAIRSVGQARPNTSWILRGNPGGYADEQLRAGLLSPLNRTWYVCVGANWRM